MLFQQQPFTRRQSSWPRRRSSKYIATLINHAPLHSQSISARNLLKEMQERCGRIARNGAITLLAKIYSPAGRIRLISLNASQTAAREEGSRPRVISTACTRTKNRRLRDGTMRKRPELAKLSAFYRRRLNSRPVDPDCSLRSILTIRRSSCGKSSFLAARIRRPTTSPPRHEGGQRGAAEDNHRDEADRCEEEERERVSE